MEKGNTVGVTVVAEDTPNERLTIEASYGTVALRISHDAIADVHRMFLTTPSLHPPLRAYHWSNGCALAFGRTRVRISEGFRVLASAVAPSGYPIG